MILFQIEKLTKWMIQDIQVLLFACVNSLLLISQSVKEAGGGSCSVGDVLGGCCRQLSSALQIQQLLCAPHAASQAGSRFYLRVSC